MERAVSILNDRLKWIVVGYLVLVAVGCAIAGSRLTFFAEDYDLLLNQMMFGVEYVKLGNGGHWAPVARMLLFAEVNAFGNWYGGYVAVNGLLLAAGLVSLTYSVARFSGVSQLRIAVVLLPISFVPGVLSVVFLASNTGWVLSFFLASLASIALVKQRMVLAVVLIVLSCLSMSGLGPFWAGAVAGVSSLGALRTKLFSGKRWLGFTSASIGASLGLAILGIYFASKWDSPFFKPYFPEVDLSPTVDLSNLGGIFQTWTALFSTWVIASLWPAAMAVVDDYLPRVTFLLVDRGALLGAFWLLLGALVFVFARWFPGTRKTVIAGVMTVLPAVAWAASVTLLRDGQWHSIRYAFVWLPVLSLGLIVWLSGVSENLVQPREKFIARSIYVVAGFSAMVLVLSLPNSVISAVNVDRPRWDLSAEQQARAKSCPGAPDTEGLLEISPSPTEQLLCELTNYLNSMNKFSRKGSGS